MNEIKERIEKSVKLLSYKIKNFDEEKLKTEEGNIEYNKMIVKKAVLADKLKPQKKSSLHSFWQKLIRKAKGKTLICDRF
ncbi:MAG: hypothetical protein K6A44_03275 [bacterium]|nr:hypothetical protein [bacterium]